MYFTLSVLNHSSEFDHMIYHVEATFQLYCFTLPVTTLMGGKTGINRSTMIETFWRMKRYKCKRLSSSVPSTGRNTVLMANATLDSQ